MAIQVRVEFIGLLREITGVNQLTLDVEEDVTLKDVVGILADRYGKALGNRILEANRVSDDALVILNGKSIRVADVRSVVMANGDSLTLAPESAP